MIPALIGHYSVKFSIGIGKSGIKALSMLKNIHIESVDVPAQNKLLKNIEDFTKKKVLLDLKRKASFSLMRMLVLVKYITILGAVGIIGYYVGDLIYKFIEWCVDINKQYKIINRIWYAIKTWEEEWKNARGNIFIFIQQNWNNGFNLYEKLTHIITACGEWLWNVTVKWINYLWETVESNYNDVANWFNIDILDDKTGYQSDLSKCGIDNIEIRSPYALDKTYKLGDPEVIEAAKNNDSIKNPNEVSGELSEEEVETKKEDTKLQIEINSPIKSKSAFWNVKDKIKVILTELGYEDIYNTTLAKSDEKSIDKAEHEANNVSINNITKSKDTTNQFIHLIPKFDSDSFTKDIALITKLTLDVEATFNEDELILKQLHTTLESR